MMDDPRSPRQAEGPPPGLCGGCQHVQIITSDRGSRFYLCRLSLTDPRFPRYPPIPVLQCAGYAPGPGAPKC